MAPDTKADDEPALKAPFSLLPSEPHAPWRAICVRWRPCADYATSSGHRSGHILATVSCLWTGIEKRVIPGIHAV